MKTIQDLIELENDNDFRVIDYLKWFQFFYESESINDLRSITIKLINGSGGAKRAFLVKVLLIIESK